MRTRTRQMVLLVASSIVAFTLAGCTTVKAQPAPSEQAPSPTRSSETSRTLVNRPDKVPSPTSQKEAIADANSSLVGYYGASFASGQAGGERFDVVEPWVTGPALVNEQILAKYLRQKHYRLEGLPTLWSLNAGLSTATQSTKTDGREVAFGAVTLVGCAQSTNHPVGKGAPSWTSQGKKYAKSWSVLYDARIQQWVIAAALPVSDKRGVSSCG